MRQLICALLFVLPGIFLAAPVTINFDDPAPGTIVNHPSGYSSFELQGFYFFLLGGVSDIDTDGDDEVYAYSVELIGGPPVIGDIFMSRTDGAPFALYSADLSG